MIEIKPLKEKIHNSDKYRGGDLDSILQETKDEITENEFLALLPIFLKLGKIKEVGDFI